MIFCSNSRKQSRRSLATLWKITSLLQRYEMVFLQYLQFCVTHYALEPIIKYIQSLVFSKNENDPYIAWRNSDYCIYQYIVKYYWKKFMAWKTVHFLIRTLSLALSLHVSYFCTNFSSPFHLYPSKNNVFVRFWARISFP